MTVHDHSLAPAGPLGGKHQLSRHTGLLIGDLLPLCDFAGVLIAAYLATLIYAHISHAGAASVSLAGELGRAALAAAVLAPFILCDRAFVAVAGRGQTGALMRCYVARFVMFAGVLAGIGLASRPLETLPREWLWLWLASTLAITVLSRLALVGNLRRLERKGILREAIAIVGAGPLADRLIGHLLRTRGDSVELLGVFDDDPTRGHDRLHQPTGSIADLIALGQSRSMHWILLALPDSAPVEVDAIVHRLKLLAVPIGQCPHDVGLPTALTDSRAAVIEPMLPPWISALIALPLTALKRASLAMREVTPRRTALPSPKLDCVLDDYELDGFSNVAARFGSDRFGYVVTPNADHIIRLHREPEFRAQYADASYVLLDSRFVARLLRFTRKLELRVCTGSDLLQKLFDDVIAPDDPLVLIGGSAEQAAKLMQRYGLKRLAHFNPDMGFIHEPRAVEACLRFIESHSPFRFCLLAVGSPQQERLAQRLRARGTARGMALCIGASINFLTGEEQRAPAWMQRSALEWLYRLLQSPVRMTERYLIRGPQIFGLLRQTQIVVRPTGQAPQMGKSDAPWLPAPAMFGVAQTASGDAH